MSNAFRIRKHISIINYRSLSITDSISNFAQKKIENNKSKWTATIEFLYLICFYIEMIILLMYIFFDTIILIFEGQQFGKMIESMASTPNWTLRSWKSTIESQLNSWVMRFIPGMTSSNEGKEISKFKGMIKSTIGLLTITTDPLYTCLLLQTCTCISIHLYYIKRYLKQWMITSLTFLRQ